MGGGGGSQSQAAACKKGVMAWITRGWTYPEFVEPEIGSKVVHDIRILAESEDIDLQLDLLEFILDHLHNLDCHNLPGTNMPPLVHAAIASLAQQVHQFEDPAWIWRLEQVIHCQEGLSCQGGLGGE